ncbi:MULTISPECIES: hypothetical protein [unclassified Bradyrhizobium]|uniref:hypothetical protein n=1 Tax=unclassified Bradyrhizobium TaxID=2631580 RepID=UPI0024790C03|nr:MULTISPECIES: hypothetical protein [unclassified Bradyrhizobium]WGR70507.1 hypothetical protein MTX24_35025 [Bradyrhizobium sp. ISRA426]WGR82563.1 hypothetical protein MTX21_20125 [Bradyrhizobium sp. ISRA430]WGR85750.1 hypothetical protein MTX25_34710 [Bradyrhizobium sp. ISRA432]
MTREQPAADSTGKYNMSGGANGKSRSVVPAPTAAIPDKLEIGAQISPVFF